jgi:tRNA threonylcarbamoyl adenosine modification protein YeaZ
MSLGLVLDLSHTGFAAVLSEDADKVVASEVRQGGTRHDDLGDWLESLLKQAGAVGGWRDVAWICVGLGPGSFTGIRIALAFAQGVALPGGIPLYGFTSFEALFLSSTDPGAVAAIPANAGRFYLARGLDDPGALANAAPDAALLTPAAVAWDYAAIARRALASNRDARKPYYLQASAAEDKAARDP